MRTIILTNWMLAGRSGMELYIRDLALGLKERGWRPVIFSLQTGALADELRAAGVPVVSRMQELPQDAALVHGHHNFMTVIALLVCSRARGLFVSHASLFWQEEPPVFPRIVAWVGVDDPCRERIAADLRMPLQEVRFIGNSVDLARFRPRAPLPQKPQRALLFSNYAAEHTFLPVVRDACRQAGLELDVIGSGVLHQVADPERVLGNYDVVFAKARCAMEALATGCATVLCGPEGVGPLVTRANFDRLRRDNFGRRCLALPMSVESLVAGLRDYDAGDAADTMRHARVELDLARTLDQWVALYEELLARPAPASDASDEARAAAGMIGKMAAPLFRLFELEDANRFLQVQAATASAKAAQGLEHAGKLEQEIERLRSALEHMRAGERSPSADARAKPKGLLARLWRG